VTGRYGCHEFISPYPASHSAPALDRRQRQTRNGQYHETTRAGGGTTFLRGTGPRRRISGL